MQPTTMAMLMVLDRPPDAARLRAAIRARRVAAVPRLAQRVRDAPLDLTLPHWEDDPTFDLDYHVRRHALPARADLDELLREIGARLRDAVRPLASAVGGAGLRRPRPGGSRRAVLQAPPRRRRRGRRQRDLRRHDRLGARRHGEPEARRAAGTTRARGADRRRSARGWSRHCATGSSSTSSAPARWRAPWSTRVQHPEQLGRALTALRSLGETMRFDSHSPLKESGRPRAAAERHGSAFAEMRGSSGPRRHA